MKLIIERFVEQPEPSRFVTVLQAEALDPEHPAYGWFGARKKSAIDIFIRLLEGNHDDPVSAARQLLALMPGLAQQWLRSPSTFPFVQEWEKAIAAVLNSGMGTSANLRAAGAIAGSASDEAMDRQAYDRF